LRSVMFFSAPPDKGFTKMSLLVEIASTLSGLRKNAISVESGENA